MTARAAVLLVAATLTAPGCVARTVKADLQPPVATPGEFAGAATEATAQAPEAPVRWWTAFGDPGLDAVVGRALAGSLELRQAWARLEQADAIARQTGSAGWPQVNARLTASRTKSATQPGLPPQIADSFAAARNRYSAALEASWEVDVWGRVEATTDAAEADLLASRSAVEGAAERLAAAIADAWYSLAEQQATLEILGRQAGTNDQLLELVSSRFDGGLATALDVFQQRQQVLAVQSQVPLVQGRIDAARLRLAVLIGQPPGSLDVSPAATLPALPPAPASGVPAGLLQRRADLRASVRRVEAADRRVAAAIADRFPALRLSARTGFESSDLADLVDGFVWSIAGDLLMPLIDGARRSAVADQRRAQLEELLAAYGQQLLAAVLEVDLALRNEGALAAHVGLAGQRLDVARSTLEEAQARYLRGLSDYLPVLASLQAAQQAELSLLSARRQAISNRIELYRALGGTWTADLAPPMEARR